MCLSDMIGEIGCFLRSGGNRSRCWFAGLDGLEGTVSPGATRGTLGRCDGDSLAGMTKLMAVFGA